MTNWKTTTLGVAGLLVALSTIWAPPRYTQQIAATGAALTSCGLFAAKDHDR